VDLSGVRDGGIVRDIESGVEYCRELLNWSRLIGKRGAGLDAGVEVGMVGLQSGAGMRVKSRACLRSWAGVGCECGAVRNGSEVDV
jgi:hypothetical protein